MKNVLNIFVVSHKKIDMNLPPSYKIIYVGNHVCRNDVNILYDNVGDNISERNNSFCELTALYWIWKNITETDYVGLVHYRRYFSRYYYVEDSNFYLKCDDAISILQNYDIIMPKKTIWKDYSVSEGYAHGAGYLKDLETVRSVISKQCPEYLNAFDKICKGNEASYCNMLVCRKNRLDEYCEWLFDILFKVEEIIDISEYNASEKRVFGYLSEILLNVWVEKNKLKVYYMPVVKIIGGKRKKILSFFERIPICKRIIGALVYYEFNRGQVEKKKY